MNLVINEIIKIIFLRYSKYFFSIRKKEKALSFDRWPYHLSPNPPPLPYSSQWWLREGGGLGDEWGRAKCKFLKIPLNCTWIVRDGHRFCFRGTPGVFSVTGRRNLSDPFDRRAGTWGIVFSLHINEINQYRQSKKK